MSDSGVQLKMADRSGSAGPARPRPAALRGLLGSPRRLWLAMFLAFAALYCFTAQRGLSWQDSGIFQWRVLNGDLTGQLGLALAHPLYIALCLPLKLFGPAALPGLMNALSGVAMAVTVANVYLLGYWLTGRHAAGVLAATALGVAHACWWLASIAEVYTLTTAGFTTELLLLVWLIASPRPWKLLVLTLVSGLGLAVHNFALLPLPIYAVAAVLLVLQRRLPWWVLPAALACWAAGASLFLGLIVREGLSSGDWPAAIRSALFGAGYEANVMALRLRPLLWAGAFIALSWPFASLLPVLVGWWTMGHRVGRAGGSALGAIAAIHFIFAVRYDVPDQFTFMLPSYVMFALGSAVGIDRFCEAGRGVRRTALALTVASIALTPVLYGAAPAVLHRLGREVRRVRQLPGRDETRYWIAPWKMNERSADRFATAALAEVADDAVILADDTPAFPLRVAQRIYALRPDVRIDWTDDTLAGQSGQAYLDSLAGRPLYVVSTVPPYLPAALDGLLRFEPAGPVHRAFPQAPAATAPATATATP